MTIIIIHPNPEIAGGVCITYPTGMLPPGETAKRDLPEGTPYLLVDQSQLPPDDYFFEAWEADFSNPDGVAIGVQQWTEQNPNYFDQE